MKLLIFIRHFTFGTVIIIVCVCMWECVCACVCVSVCPHTYTHASMTKNQYWAFLSIALHPGSLTEAGTFKLARLAGQQDPETLHLCCQCWITRAHCRTRFLMIWIQILMLSRQALYPQSRLPNPCLISSWFFWLVFYYCLIYNSLVRLNHRFVCIEEHTACRKGTLGPAVSDTHRDHSLWEDSS